MKFTSFVIAVLTAASQISSSFAQFEPAAANPDSAVCLNSGTANINVIANDFTGANTAATASTVVTVLTQPVIVSGNGVGGAGTAVVNGVADGTVNYFPVAGFVGKVTFTYDIPGDRRRHLRFLQGHGPCLTGIVTVTVTGQATPVVILGEVSTAEAVETAFGGVFNAAASTRASPRAATLTALLGTVTPTDNNDFLAKTSTESVRTANSIIATDFLKLGNLDGV